jgi:hypothetical protein
MGPRGPWVRGGHGSAGAMGPQGPQVLEAHGPARAMGPRWCKQARATPPLALPSLPAHPKQGHAPAPRLQRHQTRTSAAQLICRGPGWAGRRSPRILSRATSPRAHLGFFQRCSSSSSYSNTGSSSTAFTPRDCRWGICGSGAEGRGAARVGCRRALPLGAKAAARSGTRFPLQPASRCRPSTSSPPQPPPPCPPHPGRCPAARAAHRCSPPP